MTHSAHPETVMTAASGCTTHKIGGQCVLKMRVEEGAQECLKLGRYRAGAHWAECLELSVHLLSGSG